MITISNTLKLQKLKKEDQPDLIQLMYRIYPPVYEHLWVNKDCSWYLNSQYLMPAFEKDLSAIDAEYYFLIANKKPIGILRLVWNYSHKKDSNIKAIKLHRLYIDPDFHGFGHGKALLKWVINKAKEKNYSKLWLEVMDSQKQALAFYEGIGFEKIFTMVLPFEIMHKPLRGMYTMELKLLP